MTSCNKIQGVRGTKDLLSDDFYKLKYIQNIAQDVAQNYGFVPVETPIFEFSEVFTKTLGESSDIITKEMYSFKDKGGEDITLRPELTAAIARMFIQNNLNTPIRLFSTGPVFRYERPQKCRQRQFHQINFEIFGSNNTISDIEIISLAYDILTKLGISNKVTLEINSLGDQLTVHNYKDALVNYLKKHYDDLSEYSQKRLYSNPLRILDSKDQKDKDILLNAPTINHFYSKHSKDLFVNILSGLDHIEIPYVINEKLVRGLDYYCHTIFEFTTSHLGSQNAVLAGGRYDNLIQLMGGDSTPAVGFAGGIERIIPLVDNYSEFNKKKIISLISIGNSTRNYAMKLLCELRRYNFYVVWHYESDNLKANLKKANKLKSHITLIIGEEELKNKKILMKNMNSGEQIEVSENRIKEFIERSF